MAKVIQFPKKTSSSDLDLNPDFVKALDSMQARLGVSYTDFLGLTGDRETTDRTVERNMSLEMFRLRTQQIED